MSASTLSTLLEKTANWDKDERYMATSDLCNELQKDIKIDATMERRICSAVLKQLDDSSNDVQTIAVKCLGTLLKKVQEAQVGEIGDKLCELILLGKAELRDIYSIGLKTLISDVPDTMGPSVAQRLTARLLRGVEQNDTVEIKLECLDNLTDLLKRFGREVEVEHNHIMTVVQKQLPHERVVVRKRATACLGSLAVVVSDPLLNTLAEHLLGKIKSAKGAKSPDTVRTLVQTIGAISRTVGYRLGRHLDEVVPLFLQFCGDPKDESHHTEAADELRENCFQGFESFVLRCPREVTAHLPKIIDVSLQYAIYDPNYSYGDDDGDDEDADMGGDDFDEDFSDDDGGGSDDDDTSWKVRRSAIKVLGAVIQCRSELLEDLYDRCGDQLIRRFKEREENVRIDVISCFATLLETTLQADTRKSASAAAAAAAAVASGGAHGGYGGYTPGSGDLTQRHHLHYFHPHPLEEETDAKHKQQTAVTALRRMLPMVIAASDRQLRGKSQKTMVAVFQMMRTLCVALGGGLEEHMAVLMEDVHNCLSDKNQALKLEALLLLRVLMEKHSPSVFYPHMAKTVQLVTASAAEDWYKIIAEALRVVGCIVQVIRPRDPATGTFEASPSFDHGPLVQPLYRSVLPRLSAHDIDQEIKECAITAMGMLLAHLGSELGPQLPEVLNLLMERLRNEITRMPTLKALALVSVSPLKVDLSAILDGAVEELAYFLRQQSRPLKQTTLETLVALLQSNASEMKGERFSLVLKEAAGLVSDADLHLAHLSLKVTCCVLAASPTSAGTVRDEVMPRLLSLSASPLLQGLALNSLLELFHVLVKISAPGLEFEALLSQLQETVEEGATQSDHLPKQAIANIAKCMAVLCADAEEGARAQTVERLVGDMKGKDDAKKHLALLVVGELGRTVDLGRVQGLQGIILDTFESSDEETKTAAAYSLGHMAVGNMGMYLPVILEALEQSRHQYLLLSALKEVIVCHAHTPGLDFSQYVDQVLPHLFSHCQREEEGVRNMVAECLGALATMHPSKIIPELLTLSASDDHLTKWTVATSLKYTMAGKAPTKELSPHMPKLLEMMQDEDLDVKKAALLMVNAAVHHQPLLVAELLPTQIIPVLYETVQLKLERTVDLGPFKHKVDDGEPLRKASLACIDTILDVLPQKLDINALMERLAKGLADSKPDVQMLCHQILSKITEYSPGGVMASLDMLVDPLEKTATKTVKGDQQVGTEVERANDQIRSALRCIVAIDRIDEAGVNHKYQEMMDRLQRKERLVNMMAAIRTERTLDG